ncbi:hypothetical protein C0992_003084 [Termitomyces sp. T32_za158]|nr:hypothetical protein C0992_003084 [Termitomyces sp. T32_za158]
MAPSTTVPPGPPKTPSAERIAEMRTVDNSVNPTVLSVGKITLIWNGHILDKDDGKYAEWAYSMKLELSMAQLWDYVFDPIPSPHPTYEPRAYRSWTSNRHLTCSFLKRALSPSEQKLCAEQEDPEALWSYLRDRHGGAVPVKQVRLLQEALTAKCSLSEPLTRTVNMIFDKIDHAFDTGEVTKDLLKSIAVLSALSDKSFAHIRSIILRDLGQAADTAKYGLVEIRLFLEGEQMLLEADKQTPDDTVLAALSTKSFRTKDLTCALCKARRRPAHIYSGHTAPWCILEGGGMAGKSADESKKARLAFYNEKRKEREKKGRSTSKVTFMPAGGSAFTLKGDSATIAAYLAAQTPKMSPLQTSEFAGLSSDALPVAGLLAAAEELGGVGIANQYGH